MSDVSWLGSAGGVTASPPSKSMVEVGSGACVNLEPDGWPALSDRNILERLWAVDMNCAAAVLSDNR